MKGTFSVTEAVRNFAELINRVVYRGEDFVLERGGRAVARITPVPRAGRLGDLPGLLAGVPHLAPEEAETLATDLEKARDEISSLPETDPWDS